MLNTLCEILVAVGLTPASPKRSRGVVCGPGQATEQIPHFIVGELNTKVVAHLAKEDRIRSRTDNLLQRVGGFGQRASRMTEVGEDHCGAATDSPRTVHEDSPVSLPAVDKGHCPGKSAAKSFVRVLELQMEILKRPLKGAGKLRGAIDDVRHPSRFQRSGTLRIFSCAVSNAATSRRAPRTARMKTRVDVEHPEFARQSECFPSTWKPGPAGMSGWVVSLAANGIWLSEF
jgi:hypothetical protein